MENKLRNAENLIRSGAIDIVIDSVCGFNAKK
jgi:RecA/RadA recombinase